MKDIQFFWRNKIKSTWDLVLPVTIPYLYQLGDEISE